MCSTSTWSRLPWVCPASCSSGVAVVLVREGTLPNDKHLVAYVVPGADGDQGGRDAAEREQRVVQWRRVYDSVIYDQVERAAPADPTFNLSGWNSTYTGLAIPD